MSSAPKHAPRRKDDAYMTPPALAAVCTGLLSRHRPTVEFRVVEPSCGDGSFVGAAADRWPQAEVVGIDIRTETGAHRVADFLDLEPEPVDVILGNPPYSQAEAFVRRSLQWTRARNGVVGFLLRLAFLESAARVPLWRAHPPAAVYVLAERPSFTGGGTDSTAYGWFVWDWLDDRRTRLEVVSWR